MKTNKKRRKNSKSDQKTITFNPTWRQDFLPAAKPEGDFCHTLLCTLNCHLRGPGRVPRPRPAGHEFNGSAVQYGLVGCWRFMHGSIFMYIFSYFFLFFLFLYFIFPYFIYIFFIFVLFIFFVDFLMFLYFSIFLFSIFLFFYFIYIFHFCVFLFFGSFFYVNFLFRFLLFFYFSFSYIYLFFS